MANRVWIELEKPENAEKAEAISEAANKMLKKLVDTGGYEFYWDSTSRQWWWSSPMGYEELPDSGKWFNLDRLAA